MLQSSFFSKTLPVPYYAQPTGVQCQSTVLRMYAEYLEKNVRLQSTGAGDRDIGQIWKDINTPQGQPDARPSSTQNSHANMMWWLEKWFSPLKFKKTETRDPAAALAHIRASIDRRYLLMASVSHERVAGHIILIIGYKNLTSNMCMANANISVLQSTDLARIVVHDPFGAFDPALGSGLYAQQRWSGGQSLMGGGERGPGMSVLLPISSVNRHRASDSDLRRGQYELMTAA